MRTKGAKTSKDCWNCEAFCNSARILNRQFKTLQDIANELDLTYNQVVEISNGRKKQTQGKYGTQYYISKINPLETDTTETLFNNEETHALPSLHSISEKEGESLS